MAAELQILTPGISHRLKDSRLKDYQTKQIQKLIIYATIGYF